jgi:hypothetical protein
MVSGREVSHSAGEGIRVMRHVLGLDRPAVLAGVLHGLHRLPKGPVEDRIRGRHAGRFALAIPRDVHEGRQRGISVLTGEVADARLLLLRGRRPAALRTAGTGPSTASGHLDFL